MLQGQAPVQDAAQHQGTAVIAIVDYGAGNLASVKKAFDFLGAKSVITQNLSAVRSAKKIVLPGVGHFAATQAIDTLGLRAPIQQAISAGIPFLGICVGMQWMFESSTEAPGIAGLGLLPGVCERFPSSVKSPHVGWNRICPNKSDSQSRLLRELTASDKGSDANPYVYYTHSYRVPVAGDNMQSFAATTEYGGSFAAVVEKDNAFGVQFHVEKSAETGLQILRNFIGL